MRKFTAALLILLPLTAAAHEFKSGDLLIDHPRIVETPPGAKVGAGYVTIVNSGGADDRLIAIESDLKVEMHASKVVEGVASMKEMTDGFAIPAGETAGLGADGTHAMFIGLKKQLKGGEAVDAVLVFEKAGRVAVTFNVEKRSAQTNEAHDHH